VCLGKSLNNPPRGLFTSSKEAGQSVAVLFSLIASAERHGVNPRTYLEDVNFQLRALGEKPTDKRLEPFLPDRWKARPVQSRGVANASAGVALALRRGVSFRPNGRNSGRSRVGC